MGKILIGIIFPLWLPLFSLFLKSRFKFYYFSGIKVSSFFRVEVVTYSWSSLLSIERTEPHECDPFPGLQGFGNAVDRGLQSCVNVFLFEAGAFCDKYCKFSFIHNLVVFVVNQYLARNEHRQFHRFYCVVNRILLPRFSRRSLYGYRLWG